MKPFIAACVAAVIIAVVGGIALDSIQKSVDAVYKSVAARLGA